MTTGLSGDLHQRAESAPAAPCVTVVGLSGVQAVMTNAEFMTLVEVVAAALGKLGAYTGSRCVILADNGLDFLAFFWALQELGCVAVPVIPGLATEELKEIVERSDASAILTTDEYRAKAAKVRPQVSALGGRNCNGAGVPVHTLDSLLATRGTDGAMSAVRSRAGSIAAPPDGRPDGSSPGLEDRVAVVMYTSGSTGHPKGVMLSERALRYCARSIADHLRLDDNDRVLTCLPLYHINALCLQMLSTIVSGAALVVAPKFSASRYWTWVGDYQVTVGHLLAGPMRILLNAAADGRTNEMRVMTFGLPLADSEIRDFATRFDVTLCMGWGLTESCGGATMTPIAEDRMIGYQVIGRALAGWEVGVLDENGNELPDGEVGELAVRSDGTMDGYLNDSAATAAVVRDRWVLTGDLGRRDHHGYFHFVERKKDMMKPYGENVAAAEVERVITEFSLVAECAVVGLPDPIRGETIVAYVVPEALETPSARGVIEWCNPRLARFKVPTYVVILDALPKTAIGKVNKGVLRRRAAADAESGRAGTAGEDVGLKSGGVS